MNTKAKYVVYTLIIITAFALGRLAAPVKVVTETKTVEVEKKQDKTQTDTERNRHVETTTTEVRRPDGTVEKTTKTVQDTETNKKKREDQTDSLSKTDSQSKEVVYSSSKVTVNALAGLQLGDPIPVYGASISKPILGPITVGAFGLTDKTVGLSLGLTF